MINGEETVRLSVRPDVDKNSISTKFVYLL
jgi:hypothetical protein